MMIHSNSELYEAIIEFEEMLLSDITFTDKNRRYINNLLTDFKDISDYAKKEIKNSYEKELFQDG